MSVKESSRFAFFSICFESDFLSKEGEKVFFLGVGVKSNVIRTTQPVQDCHFIVASPPPLPSVSHLCVGGGGADKHGGITSP